MSRQLNIGGKRLSIGGKILAFPDADTMTLSEHLADQIDSRIAVPGTVDDIYATYPARNSNCWAVDVDMTCICVEGNGVLIAPDVILDAAHLYSGLPNGDLSDVANGQTRTFVDASGTAHTVTVADSGNIEISAGNFSSDIFLMRLTAPVPAGVTFAKVAPENFRSLLDLTAHMVPIVIATNGAAMNVSDLSWNRAFTHIGFEQPTDVTRLAFYQDFFSGISGSPGFAVYEGELVNIGTAHTEAPDETFFPTYYKTLVNAKMSALGSSYTLTEATFA